MHQAAQASPNANDNVADTIETPKIVNSLPGWKHSINHRTCEDLWLRHNKVVPKPDTGFYYVTAKHESRRFRLYIVVPVTVGTQRSSTIIRDINVLYISADDAVESIWLRQMNGSLIAAVTIKTGSGELETYTFNL